MNRSSQWVFSGDPGKVTAPAPGTHTYIPMEGPTDTRSADLGLVPVQNAGSLVYHLRVLELRPGGVLGWALL